ncbi:hypothetical protein [Saccharibacillus endophyticus]|uniref:hypothetical protein n=1 Tax=Saccharibacillus endophyticus TaxID=2060666 RepID=UPI001E2BBCD9|nr:hypothetical protein [Saccharibacillus endophyticus]
MFSALSRVFAEVTRKNLTQPLFEYLVAQCYEAGSLDGTHVAIDSAAVHVYEKKEPKRKSELTGDAAPRKSGLEGTLQQANQCRTL